MKTKDVLKETTVLEQLIKDTKWNIDYHQKKVDENLIVLNALNKK